MSVQSREYWNDVSVEMKKAFWIERADDRKVERFLKEETNLERCFNDALWFARDLGRGVQGKILDVGAGVAWSSAIISRLTAVTSVTALDYSQHRLFKIAPLVFEQLAGEKIKFEPIVGDFFEHSFKQACFDVVLFCQALYHFPDIDDTLRQVSDLLAPGGIVIITCERITPEQGFYAWCKRGVRSWLQKRADVTGNHFRVDSEYRHAIQHAGLEYRFQELDYPVYPGKNPLSAGNHFGIKR
ncbi:MAG: class I SAM-dependent methyltransferase [Candidatus Omnitrophota bacterium]